MKVRITQFLSVSASNTLAKVHIYLLFSIKFPVFNISCLIVETSYQLWFKRPKVYSNGPDQIIKTAAVPIYEWRFFFKNLLEIGSTEILRHSVYSNKQ